MSDSSKRRRVAAQEPTSTQLGQRRGMADPREAVKARVRGREGVNGQGRPPGALQGSDRPAPPPLQARRWAQALRDIEDPLKDLTAVKRGVRGLLDVCKNGACGAAASAAAGPLRSCAHAAHSAAS